MNTYRMHLAAGEGRKTITVKAKSRYAALDMAAGRRVTRMFIRDGGEWRLVAALKQPPELVLL